MIASLWYGAEIIKWRKKELLNMDTKTRKLLTVHEAFKPKSDTDTCPEERARKV